jgi:hypothetical protein
MHLVHGVLVGTETVPPVHQGHRPSQRLQRQRPVERAVSPAYDDHVLVGVGVQLGDEVDQATAEVPGAGGQRSGRESPKATGDDHHAGSHSAARRTRHHDRVGLVGDLGGLLAEQVGRGELGGLGDEGVDELATADGREAGHVVNHLLRVHGGHLATGFG